MKRNICVRNSYVTFLSNNRNSHGFHKIDVHDKYADNEARVRNCYVKDNGLKNLSAQPV